MTDEADPRIPALQLLLSNADDHEKKTLFAKAFSYVVVPRTDAEIIREALRKARIELESQHIAGVKAALNNIRVAQGMIALNV
jgi:hypothetical protein